MTNYLIQVDYTLYERTDRGPRPAPVKDCNYFTLTEAFNELRGCRNAHILRDGPGGRLTVVVQHAGRTASDLVHKPSGRVFAKGHVRGQSARWPGLTRWSRLLGPMRPAGAR